jgi:hypothetical protein
MKTKSDTFVKKIFTIPTVVTVITILALLGVIGFLVFSKPIMATIDGEIGKLCFQFLLLVVIGAQ